MVGGRNGARLSAVPSLRALPGLPSAVVTGLLFLQVPPYPEVFRDSVHTYKLNEQDTDVRTALPLPLSTPAPPAALLILTLLRPSLISCGPSYISFLSSLTAKTTFCLGLLSFLPLTPTSHHGCVCFSTEFEALLSTALACAYFRSTDFVRR